MPVTTTSVANYRAWALSREYDYLAAVRLYNTSGTSICLLKFYPPESTPPHSEIDSHLGFPVLSYPLSAFPSVVDILRNEKPVSFNWDGPPNNRGYIYTSTMEPVGEEEGI